MSDQVSYEKLQDACPFGGSFYMDSMTKEHHCVHTSRRFSHCEAEGLMMAGATMKRPAWGDDEMADKGGAFERKSGVSLTSEDLDANDWFILR